MDVKRLGFLGCGPHATRLAQVFTELGAIIQGHDRKSDAQGPIWAGPRMPWREMLREVDAMVAVGPPDVTTDVVLACMKASKPCLATKPLVFPARVITTRVDELLFQQQDALTGIPGLPQVQFLSLAPQISRELYVDLWRTYSPSWQAMKAELAGKQIDSVSVVCVGDGPVRDFSGICDYGPHALAFVGDLLGKMPEVWQELVTTHGAGRSTWEGTARFEGTSIKVETGNAAHHPQMRVSVSADGKLYEWVQGFMAHGFAMNDMEQVRCNRNVALRAMCRAFLNGEPSNTLKLSIEGMRVLQGVVG